MTITDTPEAGTLRAERYRDARAILDTAEANPSLPFPSLGPAGARFHLIGTIGAPDAPRILAGAERILADALDVTFTGQIDDTGHYYILQAVLGSGMSVQIHAWAQSVAIRRTTVRVPESAEWWLRIPAEADGTEAA